MYCCGNLCGTRDCCNLRMEGVFAGLCGNRKVGKRILAGTFYIVREIDGDLYSLTDADIARLSYRFRNARRFADDKVIDSWFDGLFLAM